MQWLGEKPPLAVSEPFRLVIERAVEQGAPEPGALVFLDPKGMWRDAMSRLCLADRRACIAVALDDEDLAAAVRWSIGGGVLLPPSSPRIAAACHAAHEASALPSWTGDPAVVAEMRRCGDTISVSLHPKELWDVMVGLRGCLEVLTAVAVTLEQPALMSPGPSLTLTGLTPAAVETAWKSLDSRPLWAVDGKILSIQVGEEEGKNAGGDSSGADQMWPVIQWPSGRGVARWRVEPLDKTCPWRLETLDGDALSSETVTTRNDMSEATGDILRFGGILSSDLDREGSPGAVVVEAVAREADRSGITLWIPGVTPNAGAVIRRWGLGVWVDGPIAIHAR